MHRSWAYENGQVPTNERLEFLGDSVLQLIVTDHLYRAHPDLPEGKLSKLRIAVVNTHALARVARSLELGPLIKLGRGEVATGGHDKDSILADTTEAVIGAVYLSGGYAAAEKLIRHLFVPMLDAALAQGAGLDHKTALQEMAAEQGFTVTYEVTGTGPDHAREFTAHVLIDEQRFGPGTGTTKRQAEQIAARFAVTELTGAAGAPTTAGSPDTATDNAEPADGAAANDPGETVAAAESAEPADL
ncbi:ribonuclease III [Enemella sp. A6]|uniref:ribonuclease III n=1 Tax=Enemella sp. A6 TaxID=3440152 RepID=UPI003EBBABBD